MFNDTVVNQALSSLHEGSLEIALTVGTLGFHFLKLFVFHIYIYYKY